MRFSEARGRKVVAKSTAESVGQVRDFLVDPASRSVVAVRLKKTEHGDVLRWKDLTAFGVDAATVDNPGLLTELDSQLAHLADKRLTLIKKRVLTSGGDEIGHVDDVAFDPATGRLTALLLQHGAEVAADRLVGVGSYAVVVQAQPETQ